VVEERRLQGKESAVLMNGVEQSKEKLEREFARSGYRDHGGMTVDERCDKWLTLARPQS